MKKILCTLIVFCAITTTVHAQPYAPGATLDPSCAPGLVTCYVQFATNGLTQSASGIGLGGTLTGSTAVNQSGFNMNFLGGNVGIGTSTPTVALDVGATRSVSGLTFTGTGPSAVTVDTSNYNGYGPKTFHVEVTTDSSPFIEDNSGVSGLEDVTFSGTYTGPGISIGYESFNVSIDSVGPADTFSWSDQSGNSGANISIIAGVPIVLANGVNITFANSMGHNLFDSWTYAFNNDAYGVTIDGITYSVPPLGVALANGSPLSIGYGITLTPSDSVSQQLGDYWEFTVTKTGGIVNVGNSISIADSFFATQSNNSLFFGNGVGTPGVNNSFFFGNGAGVGASAANFSALLGLNAGSGATSAYNSNFFGQDSGNSAANANNANFFGLSAGASATDASNSNFFGNNAGSDATRASNANFFGTSAGLSATDAINANFFGPSAGLSAERSHDANFFGSSAGNNATDARYSNFFGLSAGAGAARANDANFFGQNAGNGATDANDANFFGQNAGVSATQANNSNFFGQFAGFNANDAATANFFGLQAGFNASRAYDSNFFGASAGSGAIDARQSNFFGLQSGQSANNAQESNFFGVSSGSSATRANNSNFFGTSAGLNAADANQSNFFGQSAGSGASSANNSNFFGNNAGRGATNAINATFIGERAGRDAQNAANSYFIGRDAGNGATNASNSFFIGNLAGAGDTVNNTTNANDYSILIGQNTSTGGHSNSIAIGSGAVNTAPNQLMIGSATRPINDLVITGSGFTTCSVNTVTGAGISCSSDERLKTNITDLASDTLSRVAGLRTVTYNWNNNPNGNRMIGFIAQNLDQQYPELVSTAPNGFLQVNYAGMTPILTKAIQEIASIGSVFRDNLVAWMGDAANGITRLFAQEVHTDRLCVGQTCLDESQIQQILNATQAMPVTTPVASDTTDSVDTAVTPDVFVSDTAINSTETTASDSAVVIPEVVVTPQPEQVAVPDPAPAADNTTPIE